MSDSHSIEGFDPRVIGDAYDAVAGEYAGKFGGGSWDAAGIAYEFSVTSGAG